MQTTGENKMHVSISKEQLAALPVADYNGTIYVVDTPEKAQEAAQILEQSSIIGFDTETKPSFRRGESNDVALVQLSTHECSFLIRINLIGLPDRIKAILENPEILKIGVSIHDDFHNINKKYPLEPAGFVELQQYVKEFKIADNSLARIYAILFGHRISKGQRLSNWEADNLTVHQQIYAALDAMACIHIYDYLNQGNFKPDESQYYMPIVEPEPVIAKTVSASDTTPAKKTTRKTNGTRRKTATRSKSAGTSPRRKRTSKKSIIPTDVHSDPTL